jgi:hypothetical protein
VPVSFEEKKAWAFLVIAIAGFAVYVAVLAAGGAFQHSAVAEIDYAPLMLWSIGGAIVAGIVADIVIGIGTPKAARTADQRDREIKALGEHVGQAFIVIGGVAALLLAILRADYFWIANAVYLGFVLSAVLGSIARLVAYRRGMPQW